MNEPKTLIRYQIHHAEVTPRVYGASCWCDIPFGDGHTTVAAFFDSPMDVHRLIADLQRVVTEWEATWVPEVTR